MQKTDLQIPFCSSLLFLPKISYLFPPPIHLELWDRVESFLIQLCLLFYP